MTPERVRQIEELYHAARERTPVERVALLAHADPELRGKVESLLAQDALRDGVLDRPAWEGAHSLLDTASSRLTPGTQLGPYKIEGPLGQGGMGEVYRARDPRLNRDVAIKVSAARFSERFEREAKAIAALNHPNICQIYDVGPNYLVMELIEGESPKGRLPPEQVERIALQIADALEAAHEKGITHRDLKPGNIKLKPDGTVKVLDFGLAKVTAATEPGETSPTLTMGVTEAGVILGTAAYMAPEQARGQKVDKRADIWAFGVVVWEMLTGERLFKGESTADVLGKVLERDIDLTRVPEKFRKLLARCLDRNVKDRLRDIGEARFLLDTPSALHASAGLRWLWPAAAAAFALAALALGYAQYRHSTEEPPRVERFSLLMPEKLTSNRQFSLPVISPDGRSVAIAMFTDQQSALWLRDLDGLNARMLPGTEGAAYPFWSPDSRSLGFFTQGNLNRIDVTGGPALTLCEVEAIGRGGAWSQNDVIVYGTASGGLFRVPAAGGTPVVLTAPDPAAGENNHRAPWFLPDGQHFLYTARNVNDATKTRVYVDSMDAKPGSRARREVLAVDTNAVYVPPVLSAPGFSGTGYLLFVRERTLMAQPFDPVKAQTTGDAVPIAEQVNYFSNASQAQFSASRNGTLVYVSGGAAAWTAFMYAAGGTKQLTWFDRGGKPAGTVGMPANTLWVALSPDGSTVATDPLDTSGNQRDVWLHDLRRGTASRFTFGRGTNIFPVWSPDGSRIAFTSVGVGAYVKSASGIGADEALGKALSTITDWSRDGRYVVEVDGSLNDIWVIPQFGDKKPFPYVNSRYAERNAKLSPDGQWLAYVSNESRRDEVYVQTFPEHGGKWQISTNGGDFPVWSRDGRELYLIGADRKLMAVEVKGSGKSLQAGVPKPLFEVAVPGPFDVSKDGRFLVQVPVEQGLASVPLTVVTNWQAGLKK